MGKRDLSMGFIPYRLIIDPSLEKINKDEAEWFISSIVLEELGIERGINILNIDIIYQFKILFIKQDNILFVDLSDKVLIDKSYTYICKSLNLKKYFLN